MIEHRANDVYRLERTAATTTTRVFGWVKVLWDGIFGGKTAPELYTYRVYDRASGRIALQFDDDNTGTDYLAEMQHDLDYTTPDEFAAKWNLDL